MDTTTSPVDSRASDGPGPLDLVTAVAWLAVGATAVIGASLATEDDDWVLPYLASTTALVTASATTLWLAVRTTAPAGTGDGGRVARALAVVVAALGLVMTVVVPWAYVAWAPVQAIGHLALAATGRREGRWVAALAVPLLAGVALAIVGVESGIGEPGDEGDHHRVQLWALSLDALAMAGLLAWRGRIGRAPATGALR